MLRVLPRNAQEPWLVILPLYERQKWRHKENMAYANVLRQRIEDVSFDRQGERPFSTGTAVFPPG